MVGAFFPLFPGSLVVALGSIWMYSPLGCVDVWFCDVAAAFVSEVGSSLTRCRFLESKLPFVGCFLDLGCLFGASVLVVLALIV
ncbi:hypothetical protein L2E82_07684 [Cichorium intybus]|uniref:Uncharacterized protein n=1 Tax=Cichorium intybus TaxID=13427 RepID=A0ACB9G4E3_CICIN|nr:hypothetical protein L2E82_07684 [Cichorium intybus]